MNASQNFGGPWTIEKLGIFSNYLDFYITALKNQKFKKIYIDAFAGTGAIDITGDNQIIEGSVRLALNAPNKFDEYVFIEKKRKNVATLEQVIQEEYPDILPNTSVICGDSNAALKSICEKVEWRYNRALLLLDPYATDVKWETLSIIAQTKAIDVWYLFPLSAVQRMLPKKGGNIDPTWKMRLNSIFGDQKWENEFYKVNPQISFFDNPDIIKSVNTDSLSVYICNRLKTIFSEVAPNPRILYNSKNSPLFLFCFAVSSDNPKAVRLAMRGANYILKNKTGVS